MRPMWDSHASGADEKTQAYKYMLESDGDVDKTEGRGDGREA